MKKDSKRHQKARRTKALKRKRTRLSALARRQKTEAERKTWHELDGLSFSSRPVKGGSALRPEVYTGTPDVMRGSHLRDYKNFTDFNAVQKLKDMERNAIVEAEERGIFAYVTEETLIHMEETNPNIRSRAERLEEPLWGRCWRVTIPYKEET